MFIDCNSVTSSNRLRDGESCLLNNNCNMSVNKFNVFINGMISDDLRAINNLKELSLNDANNILIYNESSYLKNNGVINNCKSFLQDMYHAILGKVSSSLGLKAEKSVQSLVDFLKDTISFDSKVILNAHSQGAIILKNALNILKDSLNNDDWDKLIKNLNINLLGSPVTNFPQELNITEWKTNFDFVTLFQGIDLNRILNDDKNKKHNIKILDAIGHNFNIYTEAIKGEKVIED